MSRHILLTFTLILAVPMPTMAAKPILTHRCARPGEVSLLGSCPITTPEPERDTCVPYCSPQRGGQWCTDCGQNGGAPSLDHDGRPTIIAELIDDGFACLLYSSDAETFIGDCEVYGWACHGGACVDSDGHRWATEEIPDPDCSAIITSTIDVLACGDGMSWCELASCRGAENPGCSYDEVVGADGLLDCFSEALALRGFSL